MAISFRKLIKNGLKNDVREGKKRERERVRGRERERERRERERERGKMKEEELESDCRKSEHNYNKRLSNILI